MKIVKIFISWSGSASKECAEALRDWLPYMNQAIEPFVSSQDIAKGDRGLDKIASELQDCSYGIVCVTRENQTAQWINFEAGALSRELGVHMLAPFLLDLPVKDLSGPLTQFQATESGIEDEVWALVKSINARCESVVDQERLRKVFERFWDDLSEKLTAIKGKQPDSAIPERGTPDILNELVALVREQSVRVGALEAALLNSQREITFGDLHAENVTFPSADKRMAGIAKSQGRRVSQAIVNIAGKGNILRVIIRDGEVQVSVTEDGMRNVMQNISKIQEHCSNAEMAAIVSTTEGEQYIFPPF